MNKLALYTITIVAIAGFGFLMFQSGALPNILKKPAPNATALPEGIVLFYGNGCPHCIKVDEFIRANDIESKLKITHLEVWYDSANAALLGKVVKKCNITANSVGVPFLFDGEKCYIGDVDVEDFLKKQAGIK